MNQNASWIEHPDNEALVLIRKWQMDACEGDACAAALLNLFEYWHNIKLRKLQAMVADELERESIHPGLLQWHTLENLKNSLLIFGERRISSSVKRLQALGFISIHKNPNPRYGFDKTRFFYFHVDAVNQWLTMHRNSAAESVDNSEADDASYDHETSKVAARESEDCKLERQDLHQQYTEITSETTSKTTTHKPTAKCVKKIHAVDNSVSKTAIRPSAFELFWEYWLRLTSQDIAPLSADKAFDDLVQDSKEPVFKKLIDLLHLDVQARKISRINAPWPPCSEWLQAQKAKLRQSHSSHENQQENSDEDYARCSNTQGQAGHGIVKHYDSADERLYIEAAEPWEDSYDDLV